ncbi:MAG TPA: sialate O-acetylesterase, partial [Oceanipulchritudo sp.]|nr:sialate O-acetylesterase [Oceanipulchritudo sp.]
MQFLRSLLRITCVAVTLSAGLSLDLSAEARLIPKKDLHVYLMMGGSEIAGQHKITGQTGKVIERCFLLNSSGEWEPARAPLNRHSSLGGEKAGLGPGLGFTQRMLQKNPDIRIGLIGCAAPKSRIEDWHMKSPEYRQARKMAKIAKKSGTLRGILWQHHSSHSALPLNEMKTLFAFFRSDMDQLNLPVVVGEIASREAMNAQLAELAEDVHAVAIAKVNGLAPDEENKMATSAVIEQGHRFADAMLGLHRKWDQRGDRAVPSDIKIVDPHIHARANQPDGLDRLATWMERNSIGQTIVSPIGSSRATTPEQREIMLSNFEKYRGKIHRFCLIEPGEVHSVDAAVALLEEEIDAGAVAFGEHYGRNLMFDDPENMLLYEACERTGLPVLFHIDQNKNMDELGLPRVERVLKTFPDCKLIAHAWWWLHFPEGTCDRQLREYPNLYADISGLRMAAMLNRDRGYTRE